MMKNIALLLLSGILLVAGCEKAEDSMPETAYEISVDPVEIEFDFLGQLVSATAEITVECDGSWRLSGDTGWCEPSIREGVNGDVITFSAEINHEEYDRSVVFSLMTENRVARITVKQTGGEQIESFSGNSLQVSNAARTFYLPVRMDIEASEISVSEGAQEWLTVADVVGDSQLCYIPVSVAANEGYEPRHGEVTVRSGSSLPLSFTVAQAQTDHMEIEGIENAIEVAKEGEILEITVRSNREYDVIIPRSCSHWLTRITDPIPVFDGGMKEVVERFEVAKAGEGMRLAKVEFNIPGASLTMVLKQATDNPIYGDFPDANLRAWIIDNEYGIETSPDSETLELAETLLYLTELDLSSRTISSLEGLEVIEGLESLNCSRNNISILDVSVFPNLKTLELTGNPLTEVKLGDTEVKSLDFETYTGFNPGGNWSGTLPSLCVFSSSKVEEINAPDCSFNASSLTLDMKDCPALKSVDLGNRFALGKLILSKAYHEGKVEIIKPLGTIVVYE